MTTTSSSAVTHISALRRMNSNSSLLRTSGLIPPKGDDTAGRAELDPD